MSPKTDNEIINGTIRKIVRLESNIYVVSNQYNVNSFHTSKLLEYDGQNWKKIDLFSDEEPIMDLDPDIFRKSLWILAAKNELYGLNIDREYFC